MISPILNVPREGPTPGAPTLVDALEGGSVLVFRDLDFPFSDFEKRFTERPFADGKAKNVGIRGEAAELKGASGTPEEQEALRQLLIRYRLFSRELIEHYLPAYAGKVTLAGTTYRPFDVDKRKLLWRVGEDFGSMAEKFLPKLPGYSPLSASLLSLIKVTKAKRSEYDHLMLHLHDALKRDLDYQASAPQADVRFQPGETWVTFSDLVMHGAMGGRYMLEQTAYLPVAAQADPSLSPHHILAAKLGRPLRT